MPLSTSAAREQLHTRQVECRGFRREDGLFDIEGRITDTKSYSFENHDRGTVPAGEPVHDMWIRLTIDEEMTIEAVEAVTDYGPYRICPDVTPNFQRLVGLRIGPGFHKRALAAVGGVHGCTHIVDLLRPVATTAFQTMGPVRRKRAETAGDTGKPPPLLNTCYAFRSDSPVVERRWPDFFTGDAADDAAKAGD